MISLLNRAPKASGKQIKVFDDDKLLESTRLSNDDLPTIVERVVTWWNKRDEGRLAAIVIASVNEGTGDQLRSMIAELEGQHERNGKSGWQPKEARGLAKELHALAERADAVAAEKEKAALARRKALAMARAHQERSSPAQPEEPRETDYSAVPRR